MHLCFSPGVGAIAIAEDFAPCAGIFFILDNRSVRSLIRIIIILSRYTIFLSAIVHLDNRTLSQRISAGYTGGRNLCLTILNFLVLDKVFSSAVFDQAPGNEVLLILPLDNLLITGSTARPVNRHAISRFISGSRTINLRCAGRGCITLTVKRRCLNRHLLTISSVLSQGVLLRILNADEAADILISDFVHPQIAVCLRSINCNIGSTIHRQQPAAASARQCASNINLTAVRLNRFCQQLPGCGVVVNLNSIIISTGCCVINCAGLCAYAILIVGHNILVGECSLVTRILLIQIADFVVGCSIKFNLEFLVATLYQAVQVNIHAADINVIACNDTAGLVNAVIFNHVNLCISKSKIVLMRNQSVLIRLIAADIAQPINRILTSNSLLGNIALNLFGNGIAELILGYRVTANKQQALAVLRYRTLVSLQLDVTGADIGIAVYVDIVIAVLD